MARPKRWAGELLREFITKQGLTDTKAAQLLRISKASLHNLTHDKESSPRPAVRARIAIWTSGYVPEESWPLSKKDAKALGEITPFKQTGVEG